MTAPSLSTPPPAPPAPPRRNAAAYALILLAVLAAYLPLWRAGLIWDDDAHVTRPALRSGAGLVRIWAEPGATQQYYPVLHSAFWLEHRLWGDSPAAYHGLNLLLHAAAAMLLLRLLRQLAVPGAEFAALLFAVHPVEVETVAWISEQKNTLSAVGYFAAALAYLRFAARRRAADYAVATLCFVLALLSKSVTATLPAALLVVAWWRRGRIDPRTEVLPLLPWFGLSAGAAVLTTWMERAHVGAQGPAFAFGLAARVQIAGHAVWFYLAKLLWPTALLFMYPRWDPAHGSWLYPAAALLVLLTLWRLRTRARGPLAVALLFVGTLFPALGFINVFPFLYSFVADHFQYLASAAVLTGIAAAAAPLAAPRPKTARALAAAVVLLLGTLTWRQCAPYATVEKLWRATLAANPASWMARTNLASELLRQGRVAEAAAEVTVALAAAPGDAAAHGLRGEIYDRERQPRRAAAEYERALQLEPANAPVQANYGTVLLELGAAAQAAGHFRAALAANPDDAVAHLGLGDALARLHEPAAAAAEFERAVAADPTSAPAASNLGAALMQLGRPAEAQAAFARAVAANPRFPAAQVNLANSYLQDGRFAAAAAHYEAALELQPDAAPVLGRLGYAYLQLRRYDQAARTLASALRLNPGDTDARANWAEARRHLPPNFSESGSH